MLYSVAALESLSQVQQDDLQYQMIQVAGEISVLCEALTKKFFDEDKFFAEMKALNGR